MNKSVAFTATCAYISAVIVLISTPLIQNLLENTVGYFVPPLFGWGYLYAAVVAAIVTLAGGRVFAGTISNRDWARGYAMLAPFIVFVTAVWVWIEVRYSVSLQMWGSIKFWGPALLLMFWFAVGIVAMALSSILASRIAAR